MLFFGADEKQYLFFYAHSWRDWVDARSLCEPHHRPGFRNPCVLANIRLDGATRIPVLFRRRASPVKIFEATTDTLAKTVGGFLMLLIPLFLD